MLNYSLRQRVQPQQLKNARARTVQIICVNYNYVIMTIVYAFQSTLLATCYTAPPQS